MVEAKNAIKEFIAIYCARRINEGANQRAKAQAAIRAVHSKRGTLSSGIFVSDACKSWTDITVQTVVDMIDGLRSEFERLGSLDSNAFWEEVEREVSRILQGQYHSGAATVKADIATRGGLASSTGWIIDTQFGEGKSVAFHRVGEIIREHVQRDQIKGMIMSDQNSEKKVEAVVNTYNTHIESMNGSMIQQGSTGSNQSIDTGLDLEAVKNILYELSNLLSKQNLGSGLHNELVADIQTIQTQLVKKTPNSTIIKEGLKTIRALLEGVAGNAAFNLIIESVKRIPM